MPASAVRKPADAAPPSGSRARRQRERTEGRHASRPRGPRVVFREKRTATHSARRSRPDRAAPIPPVLRKPGRLRLRTLGEAGGPLTCGDGPGRAIRGARGGAWASPRAIAAPEQRGPFVDAVIPAPPCGSSTDSGTDASRGGDVTPSVQPAKGYGIPLKGAPLLRTGSRRGSLQRFEDSARFMTDANPCHAISAGGFSPRTCVRAQLASRRRSRDLHGRVCAARKGAGWAGRRPRTGRPAGAQTAPMGRGTPSVTGARPRAVHRGCGKARPHGCN
jgi:hypothetical protein